MTVTLFPPPDMPPPPPRVYAPPPGGLRVIYRDDAILIIDKPAGLLSAPGNGPQMQDSVASRAEAIAPGARVVHRLDMDTSGVMVLALDGAAHRHLGLQFERRHLRKTYQARVQGRLAQSVGRLSLPLGRDWPNRPRQKHDPDGRWAVTDWEVMWREPHATRLLLRPLTGRTHQLRVHMLWLGHPILGDPLYAAGTGAPGLQLHAAELALRRPQDGRLVRFTAPCPF